MPQLIEIEVGPGWTRYQPDRSAEDRTPIPPGRYYKVVPARGESRKFPAGIKRGLDLLDAIPPGGGFVWLASTEPWVRDVAQGRLEVPPPARLEPDWTVLGVDPNVLRPWQREALTDAWTELATLGHYRRGWIVSLGGGKTLFGLILAQMVDTAAVLADRYLHETWRSEAAKWGLPCPLLSTYESAHKLPEDLDAVIIDEVLRVKSPDAKRSQRITKLAEKACIVIGMTGTPTGGKGPVDFRWLRCVAPGSVPPHEVSWQFLFGTDTELKQVGPNNAYVTTEWNHEAVGRFVAPFIRTVDTSSLLAHLPEIEYRTIEIDAPPQFRQVVGGIATTRGVMKAVAQSRQITDGFILDDDEKPVRLTTGAGQNKLAVVQGLVESLGEPVVIYSAWTEGVALLAETFANRKPSVLSGALGGDVGDQVARFKNGGTDMLIANSRFSQGMNLQERCRILIFLSVSSRPDDYQQALGRVYRPGQTRGCVVIHVVCKNTLDQRSIDLVRHHKGESEAFVDKLLLEEFERIRDAKN